MKFSIILSKLQKPGPAVRFQQCQQLFARKIATERSGATHPKGQGVMNWLSNVSHIFALPFAKSGYHHHP